MSTPTNTSYRDRLYERYATVVRSHPKPLSMDVLDHWGSAYDTYFRRWLPHNSHAHIVDLACGHGGLLRYFAKRGYTNVLGVDLSPEQVHQAQCVHPNVVLDNIVSYMRCTNQQFDLITAIDVIEHLTRDEGLELLEACVQRLRPGGRIILQTPNMASPWGLAIRYGDNTHELGYTPKSLGQLLHLCGLENIECREMGPVCRSFKSTVRWGLWKGIKGMLHIYNLIETGSAYPQVLTRVFAISACRPV